MKYLLTVCVLWFAIDAIAQEIPVDEKTGLAYFEGVNQVAGVTMVALYDKAMEWIKDFYPNPTGVVLTQDKEAGTITGRARFRIKKKDDKGNEAIAGFVSYDFKLTFRDERYKYEISGIHSEQGSYYDVSRWMDTEDNHYDPLNFPYYIEQTNAYFESYFLAMKEKIEEKEAVPEDDW